MTLRNSFIFFGNLSNIFVNFGCKFSLFVDEIPQKQDDFSSINIIVLAEPNEYFNLHDWTIQNKNMFQAILTWNDKILNTCDNSLFFPFGQTWFKPDQYALKN